jgi:hypothetical protein
VATLRVNNHWRTVPHINVFDGQATWSIMIDWWNLAGHAVWIFGASVLLARFSYRSYEKSESRRLGLAWRPAKPDRIYRLGLLLVSIGLGAVSSSWLERGVWGLLAIMSVVDLILAWRSPRPPEGDGQA